MLGWPSSGRADVSPVMVHAYSCMCVSIVCVQGGRALCVGGENGKISGARLERKSLIQQFEPQIVPKYDGKSYHIEKF